MVKVINWMEVKEPPENVTVHDMRYGIGCMNELTVTTADLFKEISISLRDGSDKAETLEMIKVMDKKTLGGLWEHFKEYYGGDMLSPKKIRHAIDDRNYFIHEYHNINPKKEEGKRMFDLIKLLATVNNQLNNVKDKVSKENGKKQNRKNNAKRQDIISVVRSCKKFQSDCVYLTELGNALNQENIKFDKKLSEVIRGFGWKIHFIKDSKTICYVKISEIH